MFLLISVFTHARAVIQPEPEFLDYFRASRARRETEALGTRLPPLSKLLGMFVRAGYVRFRDDVSMSVSIVTSPYP